MIYIALYIIGILSVIGLFTVIEMIVKPIGKYLADKEIKKAVERENKLFKRRTWEKDLMNTATYFNDEVNYSVNKRIGF